ncbi:MAG TPA: DUF2939 domain-containing protein [Trinickia sp.]|jgi:hypothetical protein|nr:DUF2939 domain-containing protein [Trinickia sp.]
MRKPLTAAATVIVAIVVIAIAVSYASPYLVLDRLKRAADARDVVTVNRYVDYPALRESIKEQVTELLRRRMETQATTHPFAALGALVGMALVDPLVDAYTTTDGVAALLDGIPPRGEPGETPPTRQESLGETASAAPADGSNASMSGRTERVKPHTTTSYRGPDEFVITYEQGAGNARYSAILRRNGWFSWKLAAVELNE